MRRLPRQRTERNSVTERTFGLAGIILIAVGWSLMIAGIIKRTLYHKKRMRGLDQA